MRKIKPVVFITGASSGIGEACAYDFAKLGCHLILCARRSDRLKNLAALLSKKFKTSSRILCFDVRDYETAKENINSLPPAWKKIDLLINNAGLALGFGPIQEGNMDEWQTMIDTNLKGLLIMTRLITPLMIERKSGHIINIGSVAGKETYLNGNVYCATKHAVDSLSKAMRIDLLPHNIRVSVVHPGMAETEFSIVRYKGDVEMAKKVYQGLQPLSAKDISQTVAWIFGQPAHVNISEVILTPAAQANTSHVIRSIKNP